MGDKGSGNWLFHSKPVSHKDCNMIFTVIVTGESHSLGPTTLATSEIICIIIISDVPKEASNIQAVFGNIFRAIGLP